MSSKLGTRTPTNTLIHRLRLMADSGGMISRDRMRTIIEAADRIEEFDERIAMMTEHEPVTDNDLAFPPGGDTHEEH